MNIIIRPTVINNYRRSSDFYHFSISDYLCGEKLDKAIAAAEGRARERTICSLCVISSLERIERELSIPKIDMEGIKVIVNFCHQSFAKAYKYIPYATIFCAEFRHGAWHVTDIYRGYCTRIFCRIEHTKASRAALINRFSTID